MHHRRHRPARSRLLIACLLPLGSSWALSAAAAGDIVPQPKAGAPIAGLTPDELDRFFKGRQRYQHNFTVAEGLGPIFNKVGCAECHTNPIGGWGQITVTRFALEEKKSFDDLAWLGGPVHQVGSIDPDCEEIIPPIANVIAKRVTNSSLAFGLIEAIPDADILANADPFDSNADGISGRVHWVEPVEARGTLRAGRFGWKAQVATVLTFSADAALNEIGITNRFFPHENAPNGDLDRLANCDQIPDIEDIADAEGFEFIDRVTDFQRFLGPPPQTPKSGMAGEAIFHAIGCAKCHIAEWTTANDPAIEAALRGKTIRPYSDFLLHNMGLLGDGMIDGEAQELEMRTPTLWNLRTRDPMLHDGRAAGGTFEERIAGPQGAIWWHNVIASEARPSAQAFFALSVVDRAKVVAFLDSLGRLEFDADGDGSIRYADFLSFQACFGQSGVTPDDACAIHDIDQDGSITLADFALLLAVYEDPNGDCNGDGISDLEAILLGAPDLDGDGIPDGCGRVCVGDLDGNGAVNGADLAIVLGAWGTPAADLNGDGTTNGADIAVVLGHWGACP
ncbi:MAG: hypothetical protein KF724_06905 [Phycisphaeraceae bacterium]|nr:hypothetical protein [Phycisphaeraceae bacterium]